MKRRHIVMPDLFHLLNYSTIHVRDTDNNSICVRFKPSAAVELFGCESATICHSVNDKDFRYIIVYRDDDEIYEPEYPGNEINFINSLAIIACGHYGMDTR
ncbi:MAG: hypothetical protein IJ602_06375 [Paludibacteraceae bacterium]|nr:hypothetical protein [Paludibacteraceae bacterium]